MQDALATNAALLQGNHLALTGAHYVSAPKLRIRTKPRQTLSIDGHTAGKTTARFSVECGALSVLVPAEFTGKE